MVEKVIYGIMIGLFQGEGSVCMTYGKLNEFSGRSERASSFCDVKPGKCIIEQ